MQNHPLHDQLQSTTSSKDIGISEDTSGYEKTLFHRLVDSVKDYAIFSLDTEGCVTSWNNGAVTLKGYSAEEIIGKHFSVFYPPQDVEEGKPEHELASAQRDGKFEEAGWRVCKDGSVFWANVVITPMRDAEGNCSATRK